jgi:hypothetical protein
MSYYSYFWVMLYKWNKKIFERNKKEYNMLESERVIFLWCLKKTKMDELLYKLE